MVQTENDALETKQYILKSDKKAILILISEPIITICRAALLNSFCSDPGKRFVYSWYLSASFSLYLLFSWHCFQNVSHLTGALLPLPGNPLHSTAMEEDFNVGRKKGKAGKKDLSPTLKTAVQQRIAAVKRKDKVREEENEKKRSKKSMAAG